ncbi:alanine--tRNA ligase [Actinopolymorpha rutila]|uniref:Alanine--tRNA ligase n=1 Tax=Actinopolymorpha rutila TaxID=446787 RepID=A0A852ZBB9_9ACTN|nr:alanyl-tRNA synthetase [Actinopolymorpha rutila]
MRTVDIRRTFLNFFTDRDHQVVPSSSLVTDDPSMLFTTAGMVQFKPYFLGTSTPPGSRLTSAQKCVRTVDIDGIGHTDRHTTFFEMLGNFSFGSYGPDEVVPWAYEFLTERLGLDPGRLWATVYRDDNETPARWQRLGIPSERIQRLGMADNYWSTGGPGPCGPCTEIFYDRGPEFGRDGGPAAGPDRFFEVWNLVFMRHVRGEGGTDDDFPIVGDLPQACVESGLGVERAAVVLQDVPHIHRTDALLPVLSSVLGRASGSRTRSPELSARIVVDHVRAAAFLLADGVLPGPDGRGYVLRRLVRRAVRHVRLLGVDSPLLADLADQVVDTHVESWPELSGHRALVRQALAYEEEAFGRTLTHGTRLLDTAIRRARAESGSSGSPESSGRPALSGRTAFELHDTYGFPVDLTVEVAAEAGLTVDTDRFAALMEDQRERARQARASAPGDVDVPYRALAERHGPTRFVGYDHHQADGTVLALVREGRELAVATEGERCTLVLDRTPMYAESGGQVGDTGTILVSGGSSGSSDEARLRVLDTRRGPGGLHIHEVEVVHGELRPGEPARTTVDLQRRQATARSHSATHVLHAVLREYLGDHARQQGSLVAPGRLRFDVSHFAPLDPDQVQAVEDEVNQRLLADPEVHVWETGQDEARAAGAIALFGETYGDVVRVVDIGDFSRELCGGTHVGHASAAGPVRIVGESSVGAGVRRLEALTGVDALRYADHEHRLLEQIQDLLGGSGRSGSGRSGSGGPGRSADRMLDQLRRRLTDLADAERELGRRRRADLLVGADRLLSRRRDTASGGWLVASRLDESGDGSGGGVNLGDPNLGDLDLRELAQAVLERGPRDRPGGVVLARALDGKAQLVLTVDPSSAGRGTAKELLTPAGRAIGGGAGGDGSFAHAGGRAVDRLDTALALAVDRLTEHLDGTNGG